MAGIKMIAIIARIFFMGRLPKSNFFDRFVKLPQKIISDPGIPPESGISQKEISAQDLILRPLLLASSDNIVIIAEKL
jgi:hypothetical protein